MLGRLLACLLLAQVPLTAQTAPDLEEAEATSFGGAPLVRPELPDSFRLRQEELLAEARRQWTARPDDPEAAIWVGRRLAYLGRYRQAIDHYTGALERFPDESRLLRHRGHRLITVRRLDDAVRDLRRAAQLETGREDRVEPDGLPNDRGIPTSTLHSNIWYHLGLAHYLRGEFEDALDAYRNCLKVSNNPDMLTATSYWLYLTLRRLDRPDDAATVLEAITPELELIENHDYHRLLLTFRRLADAHELWEEASADPAAIRFPTVGYGFGAWHLVEGRPDRARDFFDRVLTSPAWAAFGYLAAEAELARH